MTERASPSASSAVTDIDVLIIGAGFSGLCMGIKLLEAGMNSFLIIEKSADIGGTMRAFKKQFGMKRKESGTPQPAMECTFAPAYWSQEWAPYTCLIFRSSRAS